MNADKLELIRRNLETLQDVKVSDLIPALIGAGVLDTKDREDLYGISSNQERLDKLYILLKEKPPERNAFECFIKALRSLGPYEKEIADKIEETETFSDPAVVSKVNPSHYEDKARAVLNKHFTDKLGAQTSLSEFKDVLIREDVFSGGTPWTDKWLFNFILKLFANVKRDKDNPQYVKNVAKIDTLKRAMARGETDLVDKSPGSSQELEFSPMFTPSQLKSFLQARVQKENIASDILDEFEKQDISGTVFLTLSESDLKEIMPTITFGMRRKLHVIIEELKLLQIDSKPCQEVLRDFNKVVEHGEYYTRGKLVDLTIFVSGNKTRRMKNFHLIEFSSVSENCKYIALQVIKFAAACMNTRRDGTIYFGISPEASQTHQAGEIIGMAVPPDELRNELNEAFKNAFPKDQLKILHDVMRPVQHIPVRSHHGGNSTNEEIFVTEFDFLSSNTFLNEETIHINPKSFPDLRREHRVTACTFTFSDEGKPRVLNFEEEHCFDSEKKRLIVQRETEEKMKSEKESPNLRDRLLNLVTGGKQSLEDDVYPFLMLGPSLPEQENTFQEEDLSFLKHLHPEVVFDFNEKGSSSKMYHQLDLCDNFRVLITDDFDTDKSSKEEVENLCQSLDSEKHCRWIFCNGDELNEMQPLNATQWNKQRKRAFQVALNSQIDNFKKDRILLIICLFSHDEGAVVQASDEILSHLPDQWILVAESKRIAQSWQQIILQRDKVEKEVLYDRCIVGMTWKQVSDCFQDWSPKNVDFNKFQIPHSNGSYIEVKEKLMKSWCDIEMVPVTDPISFDENKIKEVEEHFYRGGQVHWLNFWINGQVLERSLDQHLKKDVEKLLRGNEEQYDGRVISSVFLYHQPGAGGTTVAKQVLWKLRSEYRCCIVHDVTDKTCDQLEEIYLWKDDHPKPLLLFIDNMDDEKLDDLRNQLAVRGRRIQDRFEGVSDVFCVLLNCLRCTSFPLNKHKSYHKFLRQELDAEELTRFKQKFADLETRYQHPRHLISFNIMKENFDKGYVRHTVEGFVNEIWNESEIQIMKFVSLLNTYDTDFTAIPVSCFDKLLDRRQMIFQYSHYSYAKLSRRMNWEANVSPSFKVLLNLSSKNTQSECGSSTIKVFHKLLAEEILETLKRNCSETVHGIILQLLQSRLFEEDNKDMRKIQKIIWRVIIVRQRKKDGSGKKEMFSDLILSIKENEGVEKALEILETFYNVKKHPIIAQQICRFYLDLRNYKKAEEYGCLAKRDDPNSSHIWNSFGQVYLHKLYYEIEDKRSKVSPKFKDEELLALIFLFQEALSKFRESQKCADQERKLDFKNYNFAGYFDELRSIDAFLNALEMCHCFSEKQILHKFLVEKDFIPYRARFLKAEHRQCLKSMVSQSSEIIQKLEDELMSPEYEDKRNEFEQSELNLYINSLFTLKSKLDERFGESQILFPRELQWNEKKLCEFRYRRAISQTPLTLRALLKFSNNEIESLIEKFFLILENVNSQFCHFNDLKTMLDMFTVIFAKTGRPIADPHFIQARAHNLCFNFEHPTLKSKAIYLEKFFYYVLFNFPMGDRKIHSTVVHDLISAEENLKKAFSKKYGEVEFKVRTEKSLFFFGHKCTLDFQHLVYHEDVRKIKDVIHFNDLWKLPEVSQILKKFSGTLQRGGRTIKCFIITQENKMSMDIQTSYPVRDKLMWHKTVNFYIGLSFAGLKAVGITLFNQFDETHSHR